MCSALPVPGRKWWPPGIATATMPRTRAGNDMPWTQNYDPFGSPWLSTLVAALPVVLLLGLLASGRVPAPLAALLGLLAAIVAAIFAFVPQEVARSDSGGQLAWAATVLAAAGNGAAYG